MPFSRAAISGLDAGRDVLDKSSHAIELPEKEAAGECVPFGCILGWRW